MPKFELHTYLSKPQYTIYSDKERFLLLVAGRRFGKTYLAAYKMRKWAISTPRGLFAYIAPTWRMAKGIFWQTFLELLPKDTIAKLEKNDLTVFLVNGAIVRLFGSQNYDAMRGFGFNGVIIDETKDIPREAWFEVIRPALSDREGQAFVIGTPQGRSDLLFDIYASDQFKKYHFTTIEGGWVSKEEIEQAKRELDERTFRQEYEAEFIDTTGNVYYAFSDANIQNFTPEKSRPVYISWDFNVGKRPMSCILIQEADGKAFAFKEFVCFNSNTLYTAEAVVEYLKSEKFRGEVIVTGDYSGNSMKSSATKSDYDIIGEMLRANGFTYHIRTRFVKSIKNRVASLNSYFCNTLGERRLFITPECRRLIDDLRRVVWREDGVQLDDRNPERTHPSDALSYWTYNFGAKNIVEIL